MNTYVAFYRHKRIDVEAETSHEAQKAAARLLRVTKTWEVTVVLAEKNGEPVIHSTAEFG